MKAKVWNFVGPMRDCLLRIEWLSGGHEWLSFEYKEDDEDYDAHYSNDSATLSIWCHDGETFEPNEAFTITHWAELPEIELDEQPPQKNALDLVTELKESLEKAGAI